MTVDEAKAALPASLTQKSTSPFEGDARLQVVSAFSPQGQLNYGNTDYEAYALGFVGGRLTWVEHVQKYGSGNELAADDLAKALQAKYGPQMFNRPISDAGWWAHGADGSPPLNNSYICLNQAKSGVMLKMSNTKPGQTYDQLNVPYQAPTFPLYDMSKICYTELSVKAGSLQNNRALINFVDSWMEDFQPYYANDAARALAAKEKLDSQVNAAHKNKPSL